MRDDRRFTDKPVLDPAAVRSLPTGHPALVGNRTLFPSTVVDVDESFPDRLLVSGKNNRKLGERITKGKFNGYALYALSLEERATCPADCDARGFCYGNGMQAARRHRVGDLGTFAAFLEAEIRDILADPVGGLMVRLHVLGDFPSVEYVAMWADLLAENDRLAAFGYTHRRERKYGGDEVGDAVAALKGRLPERFRIRWSGRSTQPDGAVVVDHVPEQKRTREGLVCPAQTDATACCASCGLCWDKSSAKDCIVFVKHGPKSLEAVAAGAKLTAGPVVTVGGVRRVAALKIPHKRDSVLAAPPVVREVDPAALLVESSYQRDLSGRSMRLIRKIVTGWDWLKFKPPIVSETPEGLFVVDGQHTAIAAASHPEIKTIPVMIVQAKSVERRADGFVAHNRDRLTMTAAQVFHGNVAAGDAKAVAVLRAIERGGGEVPRLPVQKNYAKVGQVTAIAEMRKAAPELVERIVRVAVIARSAPISTTIARALQIIFTERQHASVAEKQDVQLASALASVKNIEAAANHYAAETGQSRFRAAARLIADAARKGA
jgi:hypothetical protein